MRTHPLTVLTAAVLASSLGFAQDPPSRAGRLSYLVGTVSFQPGGEEKDWAPAELNRPLTTGDRIWVEDGARAEVQTGNSAIRLNGRTNFSILNLDDSTIQAQLSLGTAIVRLRALDANETYEIDTPQVAFTLLRPGTYRLQVNENGDATMITVRGGDGEMTANGQASPLHQNEQVLIRGTDNPVYDKQPMAGIDEFDSWSLQRDKRDDTSVSMNKVSRGVPGVADFDVYGSWRPVPTYGDVWFPNGVVADWAPYRYGHWSYVDPWSWTWVDDAPWGYTPFHYGRWVTVGGVWGWTPGPIVARPIYAPALVSYVGGVQVGIADPVSWVPLSYGEVYYPPYHVSQVYYTNLNMCGSVFAAGVLVGVWGGAVVNLAFWHNPAAVTVISRTSFIGGHYVGREYVHREYFGARAFEHARYDREGAYRFAASREARFGGRAPFREGARGFPPHAAMARPIVTRHEVGPRVMHEGGFRGAGVVARYGPSANAGHAGAYRPVARPSGPPAGMHNAPPVRPGPPATAVHSGPPSGGMHSAPNNAHNGPPVTHNTPNGMKSGDPSPAHNGPSSGMKAGAPVNTHPHGPSSGYGESGASGGPKSGPPASGYGGMKSAPSGTPAGGTPHPQNSGGMGMKAGGSGGAGMGQRPVPQQSVQSHNAGSGETHTPQGGGAKQGNAPATHTNSTSTHKK